MTEPSFQTPLRPLPHPEELRQSLELLWQAVRRHRADVWGERPVDHPSDQQLYETAQTIFALQER